MNQSTFHQAAKRQEPGLWQGVLNSVRNVCLNWEFSRAPSPHSPCSRLPLWTPLWSLLILYVKFLYGWTEDVLHQQFLSASSWWVSRGAGSGDKFSRKQEEKREYGPRVSSQREAWLVQEAAVSIQPASCQTHFRHVKETVTSKIRGGSFSL